MDRPQNPAPARSQLRLLDQDWDFGIPPKEEEKKPAQCPKFLRQTFVEWAGETIPRSFWAAAYYRQQRDRGCSHQAALRALAFKWIRILYRCWQNRTPYDESTYLNALKRRGSPLLDSIAASP